MTTSEAGPVLERNPEFCFHFSLGLHPDVPEGLKRPSLEALFFSVLRCPRSRSLVLQPSCVKSPAPSPWGPPPGGPSARGPRGLNGPCRVTGVGSVQKTPPHLQLSTLGLGTCRLFPEP